MTQPYRFGIVGHNISYTLSPKIFSAIFDIERIAGDFTILDIAAEEFDSGLGELKSWDGFSVTVPYKEMLLSHTEALTPEAREIGAVNSVRVDNGRFFGYNTDAEAFVVPLRQLLHQARRILILGHGGAARAVLWALVNEYHEPEIYVCGRDEGRVAHFVEAQRSLFSQKALIHSLTRDNLNPGDQYDLIVNGTPMGGRNHPGESPIPDGFHFSGCPICYDLIYSPARTPFLFQATEAGCRILNGMQMLVRQAVASYNIWAGRDLDTNLVSRKIVKLLEDENEGAVQ
jgi:shikimate dehydrogenase